MVLDLNSHESFILMVLLKCSMTWLLTRKIVQSHNKVWLWFDFEKFFFQNDLTKKDSSWTVVSYHEKLARLYRFGSVTLNDEVYVFGGSTFKQDVLKMNQSMRWMVFPQVLRTGRHGFRSVAKGDQIIFIGFDSKISKLRTLFRFLNS